MKLKKVWKDLFLSRYNTLVWGGFMMFALTAFIFVIVEKNSIAEREMIVSETSQQVEDVFVGRLYTDAQALYATKAVIGQLGADPEKFDRYVLDLNIEKNYPGMQGLGYVTLEGVTSTNPVCTVQVIQSHVFDDNEWVGKNLCADENIRDAIIEAVTKNNFAVTDPMRVSAVGKPVEPWAVNANGFMVFYPLYKGTSPSPDQAVGVAFAPIDTYALFSAARGAPAMENETYNYRIDMRDGGNSHNVYRRFEKKPNSVFKNHASRFSIFGRDFTITVEPFNNYYTFQDIYLSYLVGFVLLIISVLILWLIRGNIYQLSLERKTNDILTSLYRETHEKVEALRKINEISRVLNRDLVLDSIVGNLVGEIEKLHPFDDVLVYIKDETESPELHLSPQSKFSHVAYREVLPVDEFEGLVKFKDQYYVKGEIDCRDLPIDVFFTEPVVRKRVTDHFCQVFFLSDDVYLVFLMFKKGGFYAVKDNEMLANVCAQVSLILKNSFLIKRVEDSSEAKNAFLANMSHEIRTPLNAIIGFSEMIFQEDLDVERKSDLKNLINKNGEQLIRIIDDILDLSKVEAGKVVVEKKSVDLAVLLHEVQSVVSLRMQRKNLEFKLQIVGKVPAHLVTDGIRLKQILLNLLGNSIKFTEIGGISLIVGHRKNTEGQDIVYFRTVDSGIGIPPEQQKKLFKAFSQGDASKTRKYGGAGLGLALSKKLAQELDGDLDLIESRRNEGSTFEVCIKVPGPISKWIDSIGGAAVEKQEQMPPERLDGRRILLVEDSPDNQDIFNYFLKKYGADVTTVGDGLNAVAEAGKNEYDMILMDIQIPEIDGKEATRRIRSNGYERPIVAVTAHAMSDEIKSCLEAGCVGQITKPVVEKDFIHQVNFYMKGLSNAAP